MKINFSKIALTVALAMSLYSCREEMVQQDSTKSNIEITDGTVKNGRLYFPNKESLTYAYDKIKNSEDEVIANYIDAKDIISLRPIVTEKNENKIGKQLKERIALLKSNKRYISYLESKGIQSKIENNEEIADDIDDLEEIVGDDAYSAFLDSRAEIQVADKIYKYTDVGLFIVKDNRYNELSQYLAVNNISDDLLYRTDSLVQQEYIKSKPSGVEISVEDGITYYNNKMIAPDEGGGGGGGYNPPTNPTDPDIVMNNYINNLPLCNIKHGLFGTLFGENDVCIDRYEDRYRVKTKAFNYNYFLVYHLGVKVKHQYKGWTGIWRKEDVQEIRLGVQGVQFQYDFSDNFVYQNTYNFGKTNILHKVIDMHMMPQLFGVKIPTVSMK